jgi:hypothetical protein
MTTPSNTEFDSRVVAIDVHDVLGNAKGDVKRGEKVINALLSSKGMLYKTARGRYAIQIRPEVFEKLKAQLRIDVEEGFDGTKNILFK